MNEYTTQTIARQRMEETARNARYAYRTPRPEKRTWFPRITWPVVRHAHIAHAQRG